MQKTQARQTAIVCHGFEPTASMPLLPVLRPGVPRNLKLSRLPLITVQPCRRRFHPVPTQLLMPMGHT